MMTGEVSIAQQILDCANSIAGTAHALPEGGDLSLSVFNFDSLSLFAFVLELEQRFGVHFDDMMLHHDHLNSIASTAALIVDLHTSRDGDVAGS